MHVLRFGAFDTRVKLSAYGEEALVRTAFRKALADCRRFEGLFSRTLAGGDIARLNAAAGGTLLVEDDTYDLLAGSLRFCEASHGLFDVTIGPVVALWDFKRGVIPERGALDAALEHVGYRNLVLGGRPGARTARLADARAAVDAGGTAKGYIADRLCERLENLGLERFVVDLGGNVAVRGGKPDGSPFVVGVRDPADASRMLCGVRLHEGSVVTSGLTERCFFKQGRRYHHILDPRTGYPVDTDAESASVVARSSFVCEGYSTTLCALGLARGAVFAAENAEIDRAVFADGESRLTFV